MHSRHQKFTPPADWSFNFSQKPITVNVIHMIQQRKQFVVQTKLVTYFDETKPDVILPQMFMFLMVEGRRRNGGKFLKIKHIKARKMSSTDF